MAKGTFIVGVVGPDLFPARMQLDKKFGTVIYNQLIAVLKLIGEEMDCENEMPHLRLGVYLDTDNPGTRKFRLSEKKFDVIRKHFGHAFNKHIQEYSMLQQKKGTDILLQLNNGNISMKEFEEQINK